MSEDVSITIGSGGTSAGGGDIVVSSGRTLSGWEEVEVTLRAEAFPNEFSLSASAPPGSASALARAGDICSVRLGDDLVVTGYVDRIVEHVDASSHALSIVGRGKTQDLVDCSAEWPGGQITSSTVDKIAEQLGQPYGITVELAHGADAGPSVLQFNLSYGETGADIIQRLARNAGLLAYEDHDGTLLLARTGTEVAASGIVYGETVQSWSLTTSMDQRYSIIRCARMSQNTIGDIAGVDDSFYFDVETDPNVPRHRLRYMVIEQAPSAEEFTANKAKWEIARRLGRSTVLSVTVDSWRDGAGRLWLPNTQVDCTGPGLGSQRLVISEATFRRDSEAGTTANLTLMPPEAFTPEPIVLVPVSINDVSPPPGGQP